MNHNCRSVSEIIGITNILSITFNSDKFVAWMEENYPDIDKQDIFPGYKFFIESAIGSMAMSISLDRVLQITDDYVFSRAEFYGTDLNKFPVTCEKTAILKNIQKRLKLIKQTINFDQIGIKTEPFSNEILSLFIVIMKKHCTINSELSFEESLRISSMWVLHNELSNFTKWVPQGYLHSPVRITGNPLVSESFKDQFKTEFTGYKYTLQYLWHCLLGAQYEKSTLKEIHRSTDWTIEPDLPFSNRRKKSDKNKRTDLDRFFSLVEKEILNPLEKKWDCVRSNTPFCLNESYSKKILEPLLIYDEKLSLTTEEKLDFIFLWYGIELLDSTQNEIFNGIPAFATLLSGAVELKTKYANGEKAIVCKFAHPGGSEKNEYSYGVLIETGGDTGFTDYSGWILCYNCCNDFTGFAGSGHRIAERHIQDYLKKDLIYLREMNIGKKDFEKYLGKKTTSGIKKDVVSLRAKYDETKRDYQEKIDESRGLILEFVTYYTIIKRNQGTVDWNISTNGNQLDILCNDEKNCRLIECKVNSKNINLEKVLKTLSKKLQSINTEKKKIGQLWFYYKPDSDFHKIFEKLQKKFSTSTIQIEDYEVISEIIRKEKTWKDKKTDKIQNILDSKSLETLTPKNAASQKSFLKKIHELFS